MHRFLAHALAITLVVGFACVGEGLAADNESSARSIGESRRKGSSDGFQCCAERDECLGYSVGECCRSGRISGCCCPASPTRTVKPRGKAAAKGKAAKKSRGKSAKRKAGAKSAAPSTLGTSLRDALNER